MTSQGQERRAARAPGADDGSRTAQLEQSIAEVSAGIDVLANERDALKEEVAVLGDAAGDLRTANDALREELRVARAELARVTELADAYDRELTLAREYADGLERERDEARNEVEQLRSRLIGEKFEARRRDEELRVARETASALATGLLAYGQHHAQCASWRRGLCDCGLAEARTAARAQRSSGEPRRDDDPVHESPLVREDVFHDYGSDDLNDDVRDDFAPDGLAVRP